MARIAEYFPMGGGENLTDSPMDIKPGELLYAYNYECDTRANYRRIDGYERYDGHPSPSEAEYRLLNFVTGISAIAIGDVATGAVSGATGEVVLITISAGSFAGGDAEGFVILVNTSGAFNVSESITVSAVASATTDGADTTADNDTDDATYKQAAIEARRDKIAAVPGSGAVRGVWMFEGTVYAFRDNAGGTACIMHKESASGWIAVDLGAGIPFNTGSVEPALGEIVTGGVSGATAVVAAAVITSGYWAAGTAAGTLYVHTVTGGPFQAEALTGSVSTALAATGAEVATAIQPGGTYEFENYNFQGASTGLRMFGVSGVDKAFQFDGTGYVPIATGMAVDTPQHLKCHRQHLFLSFDASVQHSLLGKPLLWSAVLGAGELGIGDTVTGMHTVTGDILVILSRNSTNLLYGTSAQDWNLVAHSFETGAIEWTSQMLSSLKYMDDRGITGLKAVQAYGDFSTATQSEKIHPLVQEKKPLIATSIRVRGKDQYRLFYTDGTFIIGTFHRDRILGWTRGEYPNPVVCASSAEDSTGAETLFFGSDNGFVYQMDKGTSFDGTAVDHFLRLAFNHFRTPYHRKRFFEAILEITAPGAVTLSITGDLSYAHPDIHQPVTDDISVETTGGFWDSSAWESFSFDNAVVAVAEVYLEGTGTNIGLLVAGSAIYEVPHTIQGAIIHYSVRGLKR